MEENVLKLIEAQTENNSTYKPDLVVARGRGSGGIAKLVKGVKRYKLLVIK